MESIDVDCVFKADGKVRVRRVALDGTWHTVEQGRQWQDVEGIHILLILHGGATHRLSLGRYDLVWRLRESPRPGPRLI